MNTQKQEIDVVQHETKWQAPELVELGDVSDMTQFGFGTANDGMANHSFS